MIEVEITKEMQNIAQMKSQEMGKLNNSITSGDGNFAGFLGEAMVVKYLDAQIVNSYDYDLLYRNEIKIDVKTKRTDVKPKSYYECSVADFNTTQNCDWYVFTRVSNSCLRGWILGFLPKKSFYKRANFCRKGDVDLSNYFLFKADCYNIKIEALFPLTDVLISAS
jgi:hypothetical protein